MTPGHGWNDVRGQVAKVWILERSQIRLKLGSCILVRVVQESTANQDQARNWISQYISVFLMAAWYTIACSGAEPTISGLKRDIEFARIDGMSLTLDAFVPEGDGPFPTCILVHGGGYTKGDKRSSFEPLLETLSQAGFAWFTIDYRLAPQHRWPACAEDVETAIRWVAEHAKEFNLDKHRIALIGESAGGHLVSYVGTRAKGITGVAAVVAFYAPHDLEFQVRHRNAFGESLSALLGLKELSDDAFQQLRDASASHFAEPQMPPYLLIHGDKDVGVPYEQSVRFRKQLQKLGNTCDLITIEGSALGIAEWEKLKSDYKEQLVAWLRKTLQTSDRRSISERLEAMGAKLTHVNGILTGVTIHNCDKLGIADFSLIGRSTELKTLTLSGNCPGLTDKALSYLSELSNLEEFATNGMQITDEGLSQFTSLKKLKSMSFFHPALGIKDFDGHGFAALKALPELRTLTIAGSSYNDRGMAAIAEIKQLQEFRTWHTYQTQAGNESLTKLTHLKSLWLGQRLRRSREGGDPISLDDTTLEVIVKLKTLESLTLNESRLSLSALRRLSALPNLKRLQLRDIDIPDASIEDLNAAFPHVKVEWKPLTETERARLTAYLN